MTTCSHGEHDLVHPHRWPHGRRGCVVCGASAAEIYAPPSGASADDFRVVCREPACSYGPFTDADGHGYSNHGTIALAKAALIDHQRAVDGDMHAAQIEQHPCPAVIDDG